jgi:hypothetical protein
MNKPEELPTEDDFAKLCGGLQEKLAQSFEDLKEHRTKSTWRGLAEVLLCRIIVFNGKRGGDASQMKVIDYVSAMSVKQRLEGAIFASLSEDEKEHARRHFLMLVKGKNNRHNAIILDNEVKEAMDLLLATRLECEVPVTNEYFFAIPKHSSFLQHSPILKKYVEEFGVSNMATRQIRKFIATLLQAKPGTLSVEQLARHMGHEFSVHNKFYRYVIFHE